MRVFIVAALAAYLLGSVSFPALIARARGVDLRRTGSRKLGGGNLVRAVGLPLGITGGLLDAAKGAVAILAARALGLGPEVELACGVAALVGQMWPVFHRFDGGRGNATAWGTLIALDPLASLVALIPLAAAVVLRFAIRPRPYRVVPLAALLTFAVWSAAIWEILGITANVAYGVVVLLLIVIRRITAGLADDLALRMPLARVIVDRALFDRSALQTRGVVSL